jgi:predicted translin family RNA/ssDNA-binding protein
MSEILLAEQNKSEDADVEFMQKLYADLTKLQEEEDLYWRQRAKVDWMRSGDRNTKFFHVCANQKKKHNFIGNITDERGQHWEE